MFRGERSGGKPSFGALLAGEAGSLLSTDAVSGVAISESTSCYVIWPSAIC